MNRAFSIHWTRSRHQHVGALGLLTTASILAVLSHLSSIGGYRCLAFSSLGYVIPHQEVTPSSWIMIPNQASTSEMESQALVLPNCVGTFSSSWNSPLTCGIDQILQCSLSWLRACPGHFLVLVLPHHKVVELPASWYGYG